MEQEKTNMNPESGNTENNETFDQTASYNKLCKMHEIQGEELAKAQERIAALEKERDDALAKADKAEMHNLQSFRRAEILKKALLAITESKEMKMGDVYELLLESNSFDLDQLLFYLSK